MAQAGQQPPHRRPDLTADDVGRRTPDRVVVEGTRQAHGHQRVGRDVLAEVPFQLPDGLADPDLGRDPSVALGLAVAMSDRVEVSAEAAEPL